MASLQFSIRLPVKLDKQLNAYAQETGTTKTRVMIDALAHYLGCADDVPLTRRVFEIEERLAALEAQMKSR